MRFLPTLFTALFLTLSIGGCQADMPTSPISGLLTPESVLQGQDGKIYVSEINGFGNDGDGQIRVIEQGKLSVLIKGLDDPKGLAMIGGDLYIADKTKIIKVNTHTASSTVFVEASGFTRPPQFLNDLEADVEGNLYVSDSGDIMGSGKGGAIYKISPQGTVSMLLDGQKDARVMSPNGLLTSADGQLLYWVDFTSGILYSYHLNTLALSEIAQGFGGGDGIVRDSKNNLYVSDWKSGKVFSVKQGKANLLKEGYQSAADIALSQNGRFILVPDMKAGLLDFVAIP